VEAIARGDGAISLQWVDVALDTAIRTFDSVKFSAWDVDLDIDSNNNSGLADPERSDWEEFLEDHQYGIGKIIYPSQPDPLIDHDPQRFVPISFLAQKSDPNVGAKFVWKDFQGESGNIRLWTVPSNVKGGLKATPVENGGHLITQGRVYTGVELEKFKSLWVEGVVAQTQHNTMAGVAIKRPDDRLAMELMTRTNPSAAWKSLRKDEVKYMVSDNADRLYPNLQFDHPERYWDTPELNTGVVLRDSLISEAVYSAKDLPQFGQQVLGLKDMVDIGIPGDIAVAISKTRTDKGFKCEIYRDYLSVTGTDYVLAFAGTEKEFADIASDVLQGLGLEGSAFLNFVGFESQYPKAMAIASALAPILKENGITLRYTGHSLGGGLASAAVIATNKLQIPANTFNAAGLHRNTITYRDRLGFLDRDRPLHPGGFTAFQRELTGAGVINAFNMQFDPLTLFQRYSPNIKLIGQVPVALGRPITLKAPESVVVSQGVVRLRAAIDKMPMPRFLESYQSWSERFRAWVRENGEDSINAAKNIFYQHKISTCHYGLMVEEMFVPGRVRKFDIFGYPDPER
jgi:hypothetical protein